MSSSQFPSTQQPHYLYPVTIRELSERRSRFNIDPPFQRGQAWRRRQMQQLIETILRGESIGQLEGYKEQENGENGTVLGMVDGHQRITAILAYVDNKFKTWSEVGKKIALPNARPPVAPDTFFKDLDKTSRNMILDYRVNINIIPRLSELEMVERFLGIQCQTPLSHAERMRAHPSKAKYTADCLALHEFWDQFYTGDTNRGQKFQSSLYLLAIQLSGGFVDLGRGLWFAELACGKHDDRITDAHISSVICRLEEMTTLFAGMQFSDRNVSVVMYQAVLFLHQEGYSVQAADRGKLLTWIKAIIAEGRRMTAAGSTYHQPINRLLYASIQRAFWEKHRTTVMRLFGVAEKCAV